MMKRPRPKRNRSNRKGGALTEMVVCIPVIVLLVFASIEACSMIFVRQSLSAAAYESVRVAIKEDTKTNDAKKRCEQILEGRKVNKAKIDFSPSNIKDAVPGEPITVTVSAPCDANSIMPPWFFGGRKLSATATMVREQ